MEKNLIYTELLDIYRGLLTDKQAEAMEYYYDRDYSLGEISELMDISRQGVRDFIKRGEAIIDEMENKLHLADVFHLVMQIDADTKEIKKVNKRLYQSKDIERICNDIEEKVKMIENGAE